LTDIIVTLAEARKLWAPITEEKMLEEWTSWDIESTLPRNFYDQNKVWICQRGKIHAYCTVRKLEYNMAFPKDSTKLSIWFKSYHRLEELGLDPIPHPKGKCHRSWEYISFPIVDKINEDLLYYSLPINNESSPQYQYNKFGKITNCDRK